jgi:dipeptidyl aminopeptidase/acylaminoacyl peptidase
MALSIDDIICAHYHQILDLVVSPDDQEVLVVFGNKDMPHDSYAMDEMNRSIWRVGLPDGQAIPLVPQEEDAHTPCWSPDGRRMAYLSRRSGQTEIWVVNRDGTDAAQVTRSHFPARNPYDGSSLCWSPDGMSIAYSVVPNGGRYALTMAVYDTLREIGRLEKADQITVYHAQSSEERANAWNRPSSFEGAVYIVHLESGQNRQLALLAGEDFRILDWFPGGEKILVNVGSELREITLSTREMKPLFSEPFSLVHLTSEGIGVARYHGSRLETGVVENNAFKQDFSIDLPGNEVTLDTWSQDGSRLFGRVWEGMSVFLYMADLESEKVQRITSYGKTVLPSGPKSLHHEKAIVFPYQGPTEPVEVWFHSSEASKRVSSFNIHLDPLPEVRIIQYPSEGWMIDALLVLPENYVQGERYPTLVYAHGGPESYVSASFTDLISARAESAAHFLATQGYAVFLPNFRGSGGYGPEFENELAEFQIVHKPFRDVMTGIDYLIEEGIADPEKLGIYGSSFGGWLTAWAVSQTSRFKGAVASLGLYDLLSFDRAIGKPFFTMQPNRMGKANPQANWLEPEVYKEFSPMEHIRSVKTPVLLIETPGERHGGWENQGISFFNGLCALGVESYLVYYPRARHNGGWNDNYKRDYMSRVATWFDHCLKGSSLPDEFRQSIPNPHSPPIPPTPQTHATRP